MHATILLTLALTLDWNADLTHLGKELPKMHPNPNLSVFHRELETLKTRTSRLQPHEIVVETARVVALVGDGHTRLTVPAEGFFQGHSKTDPPKDPSLNFHVLPVRFAIFDDGLTIIDAANRRLVGARATRVGRLSAEEAIAAVMPVAHGDNEMQKKEVVATYLAMLEMLHARGVIESLSEASITLESGETIVLKPGTLPAPPPPAKPWSFKHLPESGAVYFDFDEVANTPEESLAQFAERMFRFVDEQPVNKLIIDLRENRGGNNALNRAILHGIIRSKKLQAPGSLFVLTGRRTFSAAMNLVIDLEKHTKAIFIGEPTGGSPNSYGDSRKLILPNSGLTVRVSTLYWQPSDPRDKRPAVAPQIPAPPTARDLRAGRDAALAAALDYFGGAPFPTLTGSWKGVITIEHERVPLVIRDGKIVEPKFKDAAYELRAGTQRLAGTLRAGGLEFLVTAERSE